MAFAVLVLAAAPASEACTAVIITRTADGRPLIWKHRDTGNLDNSIRHFKGERYSFVGLADSSSPGGEVWAGVNTAGFAVINTASYCLKNDDVPSGMMDREGILMYRALEICATVEDFRHFLDTLARPMGVEANFGCIDACGGAAWFETGNQAYVMRDLAVSGRGFEVVTNFSWSGDRKRWRGVERWKTASGIFNGMAGRGSLAGLHPLDEVLDGGCLGCRLTGHQVRVLVCEVVAIDGGDDHHDDPRGLRIRQDGEIVQIPVDPRQIEDVADLWGEIR